MELRLLLWTVYKLGFEIILKYIISFSINFIVVISNQFTCLGDCLSLSVILDINATNYREGVTIPLFQKTTSLTLQNHMYIY